MHANKTKMITMENAIINSETLKFALSEIHKYFAEWGNNQPPLPENVSSMVPFDVHITSTLGEKRIRTGNIKLLTPDGTVCYEADWQIDKN